MSATARAIVAGLLAGAWAFAAFVVVDWLAGLEAVLLAASAAAVSAASIKRPQAIAAVAAACAAVAGIADAAGGQHAPLTDAAATCTVVLLMLAVLASALARPRTTRS